MRRSNLILLLMLAVDAVLLGIMAYLLIGLDNGTIQTAIEQSQAEQRVKLILGGAVAVFTIVALLAFAIQRLRQD